MTRFQIIGIFEDKILTAGEFNSNGDFEGMGKEVCSGFKRITTEEEYRKLAKDINEDGYNYPEDIIYDITDYRDENGSPINIFDFCDLDKKGLYYDVWFSDYLYIKNFSFENFILKDNNGTEITIHPNGYVTLWFGEFVDKEEEDKETLKTTKSYYNVTINKMSRYEEICENLGWTVRVYPDDNLVELEKYSRAGEDFGFSVSINDFVKDVCDYADSFDVDEHVRMWLEAGEYGQPTSVRTLLEDAEDIDEMLSDLANALKD